MCNTKTEPQGKLRILDDCDVSMWIHSWLKKSLILMSNVDDGKATCLGTGTHTKPPFNFSFPGGSVSKKSACNAGDLGSIPGSGISPREGNQFSSVAQSCPTLCDPMNCSTTGLPVHQQLPEFTQTHVHRVSDAIQPSHPLSSPSPPAPNPSQHQSLFQ